MSEYLNEDICQFSNDASASSFGYDGDGNKQEIGRIAKTMAFGLSLLRNVLA